MYLVNEKNVLMYVCIVRMNLSKYAHKYDEFIYV